jgi:hypothetical protein
VTDPCVCLKDDCALASSQSRLSAMPQSHTALQMSHIVHGICTRPRSLNSGWTVVMIAVPQAPAHWSSFSKRRTMITEFYYRSQARTGERKHDIPLPRSTQMVNRALVQVIRDIQFPHARDEEHLNNAGRHSRGWQEEDDCLAA